MVILTKIWVFAGLGLLLLLIALAGYSCYQIQTLSLPISQIFAIITLIFPLATATSARAAYAILRNQTSRVRPALFLAIVAFQLIYETIIATLSLTYIVPNCRLEERWTKLYKNKEGDAIRRIQDRFNCCGFNTAVDHAWPFPHGRPEDGFGADQCERMFGRTRPCSGPWGQWVRINAGLFFTVAATIFVAKIIVLIVLFRNDSSWMRFFEPLNTDDLHAHPNSRSNVRLLIDEGGQATAEEHYHDEVNGGHEENVRAENTNGNRGPLRVGP